MSGRIAVTYSTLLIVSFTFLALLLFQIFRSTYLQTLERGLADEARLIAVLADDRGRGIVPESQLAALVRDLFVVSDTRITIVARDGTVRADSLTIGTPDNLLQRPEVRDAFALGQGESERYSAATDDNRLYVAVPIGPPASRTGVARVGIPIESVAQSQAQLAGTVMLAALIPIGFALCLAILLARRTTQPLLAVRSVAKKLAAGDLDVQVPIPRDEEVADLARDFNQMASRLRHLIYTLETERQRLSTVLATMVDGILILDEHNRIILANRAAEQLIPLPASSPIVFVELPIASVFMSALQRARTVRDGQIVVVEEIRTTKLDQSLRALVTDLAAQDPGHVLIVLQDLTDLRRAERTRHAFMTNVSHDFRTPLASIQAISETLQAGALDDPAVAQDFLRRMGTEVENLTHLVNEFLDLSRIESGEMVLNRAPHQLTDIITHSISRIAAQAQHHGVTVRSMLEAPFADVLLDRAAIERVFLNILQNALTYTPRGGTIIVRQYRNGLNMVVQITDTGRGIDPEDLPHIFERFYRADRSRSSPGTGLGLAIARQLIERHGGAIWVESQSNYGTSMMFSLPITSAATILNHTVAENMR